VNPGSPEAIKAGCLCPVLDNYHGLGLGDGKFWINADCPLHGQDASKTRQDADLKPAKTKTIHSTVPWSKRL